MPDELGELEVGGELQIGGGKYTLRIESVTSPVSGKEKEQATGDARVSFKVKDNKADCFLTREEQLFLQERSILQLMLNQNENSRMASFRWSLSVAAIFVVALLSRDFDLSGFFYFALVAVFLFSLIVIELRNQFLYLRIKQRAEAVEGFFAREPVNNSKQLTPLQIEPIFDPKKELTEKKKEAREIKKQLFYRSRFKTVFAIELFLFITGAVALGFIPGVSEILARVSQGTEDKVQSIDTLNTGANTAINTTLNAGKWHPQAETTLIENGCIKATAANPPLQLTVVNYKNNLELYETVCENGVVKSVKCSEGACTVEKAAVSDPLKQAPD